MTAQYFELMGALFALYVLLRVLVWWQLRLPEIDEHLRVGEGKPLNIPGHAIDSRQLAERVEHVRHHYESGLVGRPPAFKMPLLVEEKREELEKLPYFQHLIEEQSAEEGGGRFSAA
jgi:hypothetical protein